MAGDSSTAFDAKVAVSVKIRTIRWCTASSLRSLDSVITWIEIMQQTGDRARLEDQHSGIDGIPGIPNWSKRSEHFPALSKVMKTRLSEDATTAPQI
eukprot:11566282-Alexandrium_andersonii.AAC.1